MSPLQRRFGTFEGVFTPCLLSILGVILYLRLGWVVGTVGLVPAVCVILLANSITLATALAISSVVTNIRIGSGGAYSVIAKSLGLEVGGAVGLPLYLAQAMSVGFYVVGFAECWVWLWPHHDFKTVCFIVWAGVSIVAFLSARLAFRMQYVIMAIIALSFVSIFLGRPSSIQGRAVDLHQWSSFWEAFGVFFPAVTGVLAGAAMSGELKDPARSIPRGTLSAVALTFVIYLGLALWLGLHFPDELLREHTNLLFEISRWKFVTVAGLMGASLSSALSMAVGAPRTLFALADEHLVPGWTVFKRVHARGEPTAAIMASALISGLVLLLGNLNKIANALTMIFLITYGVLNFSVFVEQTLGLASFRPRFVIPRWVTFYGGVGCFVLLFILDPLVSFVAIVTMTGFYMHLVQQRLRSHSGDVRSGLLLYLAERLALQAAALPYSPKIWKPNLFVVVDKVHQLDDQEDLLRGIIAPSGRMMLCHVIQDNDDQRERVRHKMAQRLKPWREEGFFIESMVVAAASCEDATLALLQASVDRLFPPNCLYLTLSNDDKNDAFDRRLLETARDLGLGLMVVCPAAGIQWSEVTRLRLWLRRQSPNVDLAVLTALQLYKNWEAVLTVTQAASAQEVNLAQAYFKRIKKQMRFPEEVAFEVVEESFYTALTNRTDADVHLFGMPSPIDLAVLRRLQSVVKRPAIFLHDSQHESASV